MTIPNKTLPAKPTKDLVDYLGEEKLKLEVAKTLPRHLTPERFLRVALTGAVKSPEIALAVSHPVGRASLFNALLTCSQAGLEPDGRNAWLVPFWSNKEKCYTVQLIFGYKGFIALGLRSGMKLIYPDVVHDNDLFRARMVNGVKHIEHEVDWKQPRGEPYLFYCAAINASDQFDYEIMTMEEIFAIRARSKSKDGPWNTDFIEMAKKCPIRRMSKRWDLLPEFREALERDFDSQVEVEAAPKERPAYRTLAARTPPAAPEEEPPEPPAEAPEPEPGPEETPAEAAAETSEPAQSTASLRSRLLGRKSAPAATEAATAAPVQTPVPASSNRPLQRPAPAEPSRTAQQELAALITGAGYDFPLFIRWCEESGNLPGASKTITSWESVPEDKAARWLLAKVGLLKQIERAKPI